MNVFLDEYNSASKTPSDIYEHIPTLYEYATKCNHITECGVRSVVSSYAFAHALVNKESSRLIQVDIVNNNTITAFGQKCLANNINYTFYKSSDLECPLEPTELLFIDTWHVYGHLKRELERWHSYTSKYIIMHDTTVDAYEGESIRIGMNIINQHYETGIPINEIKKGLWPAIEEFLANHSEWIIDKRFTNNNGLTILKRV